MMMKIVGMLILIGAFALSQLVGDFWTGFITGLIAALVGGFLILKG